MPINEKWWREPVVLEIDGVGRYRVVRSTREAAQILLETWPVTQGAAYKAAIRMCRYVLAGEQPADYARQDFIDAAEEAFIHVQHNAPPPSAAPEASGSSHRPL